MPQTTKSPDRICVMAKDQLGGDYAYIALSREAIIEATYIFHTGVLQLVLATTSLNGETIHEWVQKSAGTIKDGKVMAKPVHGTVQQTSFFVQGQHNALNIGDDDEIKRVWEFINTNVSYDDLQAKRREALAYLEDFKAKKRKEQEDKLEAALKDKEASDPDHPLKDLLEDEQEIIEGLEKGTLGKPAGEPVY